MSRNVSLPGALLLLIVIILFAITSQSARAGTNYWTGGGPEGGPISQLAVARSNPSIVYLSSEGGVFKSTDAGSTWQSIYRAVASSQSLVIDPDDPDTVYWYSIENGVLKTTDGGKQWRLLLPYESNAFYSFVVNPDRPEVLYLLRQGNNVYSDTDVFSSTDGGTSWNRMAMPLPGRITLVAAGHDPEFIYASIPRGLSPAARFRSNDSGQTWTELEQSMDEISPAPGDGRTLYGLTVSLTSECDAADHCTYRYDSIVWKSTDAGTSWTPSFQVDHQLNQVRVSQGDPSDIYAVGSPGYRSNDAGQTWSPVADGGNDLAVLDGDTLLAFDSLGVRKSLDGGDSWVESNSGLTGLTSIRDLWLATGQSSRAYIRSAGGVFSTDDRGASWQKFEIPEASDFEIADSSDPDVMYLVNFSKELYRSDDAGAAWNRVYQFPDKVDPEIVHITIDPRDPDTLYATHIYTILVGNPFHPFTGSQTDYSRSTDGGESWSIIDFAELPLLYHPTMKGTWWTVDKGILLKTSDSGQTFETVAALPPGSLASTTSAEIDPADPLTMYVSGLQGLWKSTDGGKTWNPTGLRDTRLHSLSIDPERSSTLLATTYRKTTLTDVYDLPYDRYEAAVVRSDDGGATWRELPIQVLESDYSVPQVAFMSGHTAYLFNAGPGGVYSMVIDDSLFFPKLSSAATGYFTGLAFVNRTDSPIDAQLLALGPDGKPLEGSGISNPAPTRVEAGHQFLGMAGVLLGDPFEQQGFEGWAKMGGLPPQVSGFFSVGSPDLQALDTADCSSRTMTSFVFTEVAVAPNRTRIHIANSNDRTATVRLELLDTGGRPLAAAVTRTIAANGTLIGDLVELFGEGHTEDSYILGNSDFPVVLFEQMSREGAFVDGLNAQDTGAALLYAPQYAVGTDDVVSTVSLVNLDDFAGTVDMSFVAADGTQIGQTKSFAVAGRGKIHLIDQHYFDSAAVLRTGYLEIKTSGIRVAGNVVFGSPGGSRFRSTLPLVQVLRKNFDFSHLMSSREFFTGVALLNPGQTQATVGIEVFDREGKPMASTSRVIPPGARESLTLAEYLPALAGIELSSGYIRVTSDVAIGSFALFGAYDGRFLAAVPGLTMGE